MMWHSVQGKVKDITTETVVGRPKVCDVTEEQLQIISSISSEVRINHFTIFIHQRRCSPPLNVMDVISPSPSSEHNDNKINYISTQSNTTMYFLPYWLPFLAITTINRPMP